MSKPLVRITITISEENRKWLTHAAALHTLETGEKVSVSALLERLITKERNNASKD